jgi:hypothetical protein
MRRETQKELRTDLASQLHMHYMCDKLTYPWESELWASELLFGGDVIAK